VREEGVGFQILDCSGGDGLEECCCSEAGERERVRFLQIWRAFEVGVREGAEGCGEGGEEERG
jgi:hypothetical protein